MKTKLIVSMLVFASISIFADAPFISYSGPKVYDINTAISPLIPTVSGEVSAFSSVSTVIAADGQAQSLVFSTDGNTLYVPLSNTAKITQIIKPKTKSVFVSSGFTTPWGVAIHPTTGDIYVSDAGTTVNVINKINPATGTVTLYAGIAGAASTIDGDVSVARFSSPRGLAFDENGNLYVAQTGSGAIRKISADGTTVSTLVQNTTIDGVQKVYFVNGWGLAYSNGFLYVTETTGHKVSKVDITTGTVTVLAGSATPGSSNGTGAAASFNGPRGITVDHATGMVYVADYSNYLIRQITPEGVVTTLSGDGTNTQKDGIGSAAAHRTPAGVALDGLGNLYVCDVASTQIRKIILKPYHISPTLPTGLTLNPATGVISGTPTSVSPATDYTITASNEDGFGTYVQNIKVQDLGTGNLERILKNTMSAYFCYNSTIIIQGIVNNNATATLYDVNGNIVLEKRLKEGNYNSMQTPNISHGVYFLAIKKKDSLQRIKLLVK